MPRRAFANVSDYDKRIIQTYLEALGQLTGGVEHEVRQLLNSVVYLGPHRSPPQRFYNRTTASKHPGDGHHIAMYLFDHSNVVNSVNEWLNALEVPYVLDVVPVRAKGAGALVGDLVALSLTDSRSGAVVTPADVGFGISQMLPIVVELLAHRESIICIEQPETHLHPRLQTRLADLLIESSRNGDLANQVIVETHSEHLMLRLQRRIREGTLDADDICILYVDQTKEGVATVKRLRINSDGEFLDQWPHGFFDERLDELFGT
jgi:predicted ATPase